MQQFIKKVWLNCLFILVGMIILIAIPFFLAWTIGHLSYQAYLESKNAKSS